MPGTVVHAFNPRQAEKASMVCMIEFKANKNLPQKFHLHTNVKLLSVNASVHIKIYHLATEYVTIDICQHVLVNQRPHITGIYCVT